MTTAIEYALMAGASYISNRDSRNQFPIPENWYQVSYAPPEPSGFEAATFGNAATLATSTEIVISFAGTYPTDLLGDQAANAGLALGLGSAQLLQAAEYDMQVKALNPAAHITLTGHSLGGGGDDIITAFRGGDDLIEGGEGNDVIRADGGNDVLLGGAGSDYVYVGGGNDVIFDRLNRSAFLNQLRYPLIQRQAISLGSSTRRLMNVRVKTQYKLAGVPFERLNSILCAHLQKHLERSLAFLFQAGNVFGIKIGTAIQPNKLAAKHFNVRVVLNHCTLFLNHHHVFHGCTPFSVNHLRIDSTAPLSVSGEGCGLWNTRTSPNNLTPMRDPSRSLTFAPKSSNSDSISRHLMLPETGRANISARVFELLRFMPQQYHKIVSDAMWKKEQLTIVLLGESIMHQLNAANDAQYEFQRRAV